MVGEVLESARTNGWPYFATFPDDWERRDLYSLAQWVNGIAFRDIQFSTVGKPVIKIAEIKGGVSGQTKFTEQVFDEAVHIKTGDLLFSWSGQPETSIDVFWWRGSDGWLNQHSFRVTPTEGVDRALFFYLLRYLNPNFVAIARNKQTTGLGHVTRADLERLQVAIPPLPEQRAIAHILGALDDKIDLNRRTNETLEAMARALFKSWFVDFDPVRAKAQGRDPGLPAHLAALFPDRLVESELGEIPEGWEVKTIGELASLNPESWSQQTRPQIIEYVDLTNTKWGRIEAVTTYEQQDAPSRAQRVLRHGDTIVGTVRPGNGSYAFISADGLTGSTGFAVLRPIAPDSSEFVYLAATHPENIEALSQLADGGAYPAVRPEVVTATQVVQPDGTLLDRFSGMVGPLLAKAAQNERESRTLAALRDALLPKLMSGEVRVGDAERFVSESLP
jgi:type I restriction enzyme S subunit